MARCIWVASILPCWIHDHKTTGLCSPPPPPLIHSVPKASPCSPTPPLFPLEPSAYGCMTSSKKCARPDAVTRELFFARDKKTPLLRSCCLPALQSTLILRSDLSMETGRLRPPPWRWHWQHPPPARRPHRLLRPPHLSRTSLIQGPRGYQGWTRFGISNTVHSRSGWSRVLLDLSGFSFQFLVNLVTA